MTTLMGMTSSLLFPPGTVSEPITVTTGITTSLPTLPGAAQVGPTFFIAAQDFQGNPVTRFTEPFTMTIRYNYADVAGIDERRLQLYAWDEQTGQWTGVSTTAGLESNTLTAVLNHGGTFTVLEKPRQLYLPAMMRNP
jgi:hypothetical protein